MKLLPDAQSSILVFVADLPRANAIYQRPGSLIWRDAGALLQTISLAATAYRLGSCPLGLLGTEIVDALALPPERALAVGCAVIGRVPRAAAMN
jgi:nitroreductase